MSCAHISEADDRPTPSNPVCERCLEAGYDDWVHLRMCLTCGNVACCDSSPPMHATEHHKETGHPVMRSVEPGESWRWCYVDDQLG